MNRVRRRIDRAALACLAALALTAPLCGHHAAAADTPLFRPPAAPLVTFDPYLSIWSEADHLYDDDTRHWTRKPHPLTSLIRIDGAPYRLMGASPAAVPPLPQLSLQVLPTRTIYTFGDSHVAVTLTFMTAALPDDMEAMSRPLSYLTWDVRSLDGARHSVQLYDSVSGLLAVNQANAMVNTTLRTHNDEALLTAEASEATLLKPAGDGVRINWGQAMLAAREVDTARTGGARDMAALFAETGSLRKRPETEPSPPAAEEATLAVTWDLGKVGERVVERQAIVAYDEDWAIDWFGTKLRPYWKRNNRSAESMLRDAQRDYRRLEKKCIAFDEELIADLTRIGGGNYATIGALAYRQCLAGCGLAADAKGKPLLFTKENTSNGDLATVDVIFPMDPMLLLLSPTLAKASLVPVLAYAASPHWKFPNAPHDLGTYPIAHGRDDGGEGMPVEESGNMLLLCDAIAQEEGNPSFVAPWWPQLTQWAHYLEAYGQDPEDQLCTDDFMGHLAHNTNLSVKAILALAAYGNLCEMRGDYTTADRYTRMAREFAWHWMLAADDGGKGHYRLAFDRPDSWSQLYNLAWDRVLGLKVFPRSVAASEVQWYKSSLQTYGVPLDSRTKLTKSDWTVWSATLAENPADFRALIAPMVDYLNSTTTRDPFSDSYVTDNIKSGGMHARPVIGGVFMRLLADRPTWAKWSGRDRENISGWAPLPEAPILRTVLPTGAQGETAAWRWTTGKPAGGDSWKAPAFDDSGWQMGTGGFGTKGTPTVAVGTNWNTDDIWLRRTITLPKNLPAAESLRLLVFHDEDVEIYINGIPAASESGYVTSYEPLEIAPDALAALKPGATVTLAAHCHQTKGGQGVDIGLASVR